MENQPQGSVADKDALDKLALIAQQADGLRKNRAFRKLYKSLAPRDLATIKNAVKNSAHINPKTGKVFRNELEVLKHVGNHVNTSGRSAKGAYKTVGDAVAKISKFGTYTVKAGGITDKAQKAIRSTGIGSYMSKKFPKLMGSAKLAGKTIPVLDIVIASFQIMSALKKIDKFNKDFNKTLKLNPGNELTNFMVDAGDRSFEEFIVYVDQYTARNPNAEKRLDKEFNAILQVIKDLLITVVLAVQPYVTGAAGVAGGTVVPIAGNILGGATGYVAGKLAGLGVAIAIHAIPFERLLFEITGEIAEGLEKLFGVMKRVKKLNKPADALERNSLARCFFTNPVKSFSRLGQVYEIIHKTSYIDKAAASQSVASGKGTTRTKKAFNIKENSLYDLTFNDIILEGYADKANALNDKMVAAADRRKVRLVNKVQQDKLDEIDELDEFSGAAAGGGGPAVPLGYTAKGKPETSSQRKKRQRFNVEKSYPYTKLANPPKSKKRKK